MNIAGPIQNGIFLRRPNRFLAICDIDGKETPCYLPNPGPMPELLYPGVEVFACLSNGAHRKTAYDLFGVRHRGVLLSLDTRIPNPLFAEALNEGLLPPFAQYTEIIPEPLYENSRLDFLLKDASTRPCLVEIKSSTHAEDEISFFPRAVTLRGQRHVFELIHAINHGYRAAMVFIVQRIDCSRFRPNDQIDPDFGIALRKAVQYGVELYAWASRLDEDTFTITLEQPLPIDLTPPNLL